MSKSSLNSFPHCSFPHCSFPHCSFLHSTLPLPTVAPSCHCTFPSLRLPALLLIPLLLPTLSPAITPFPFHPLPLYHITPFHLYPFCTLPPFTFTLFAFYLPNLPLPFFNPPSSFIASLLRPPLLPPLLSEAYAPQIVIDYTSILGGHPFTVSSTDWVNNRVAPILDGYLSTQHVTSGIVLPDLPQPGPNNRRPSTVKVYAQVSGNTVSKPKDGEGPKLAQNGDYLEAEVQRFDELETEGGNPWRITKYKVVKGWESGDAGVMEYARERIR